jgi:divalent metal cation (Fe/Co/Zn/Cd) transporter
MTPVELPTITVTPAPTETRSPTRDAEWQRTAARARLLSWISLAWMTIEGVVGLIAGLDARSLSVIVWASSSFVEALAAIIVIWRFTGTRTLTEHSEHTAQRLVAGSFLLLVPFFLYEAARRLIDGGHTTSNAAAVAVTASAIVLMPIIGAAKLRLGDKLGSGATSGEGIQNLMCAAQALAALVALIGASAGLGLLDPIVAILIAAAAAKEGVELWQGDGDCCAPIGFSSTDLTNNCECC